MDHRPKRDKTVVEVIITYHLVSDRQTIRRHTSSQKPLFPLERVTSELRHQQRQIGEKPSK